MTELSDLEAFGLADLPWHLLEPDTLGGDFAQFAKFVENAKNESDRGLALICTSFIDEMLRRAISAMLVDETAAKALLDGFNSPLGSFGTRIKMGYALGIVTRPEMDDLDNLRRIRNQFAHSFDTSFDDTKVRAWCRAVGSIDWDTISPTPTTRGIFSYVGLIYALKLTGRLPELPKHKCKVISWPSA